MAGKRLSSIFLRQPLSRQKTQRHLSSSDSYQVLEPRQLLATFAPGELDPRFGAEGNVQFYLREPSSTYDIARDAAYQSDGKLLVAGGANIVRYLTDGAVDTSFGDAGHVQVDVFEGGDFEGNLDSIHVLPNGQFLVAGPEFLARSFLVAKFNPDGSLDTSFGDEGYARKQFPAGPAGSRYYHDVSGMHVLSDGRILVIGETNLDDGKVSVIAFQPNGSVDSAFADNGQLDIPQNASLMGIKGENSQVDAQGNLLVGLYLPDSDRNTVVRVAASGAIDTTYGNSGFADVNLVAANLALQDDGKLFVTNNRFEAIRLNADGTLDSSFGSNGQTLFDLGNSSLRSMSDVETLPNGGFQVVASYGQEGQDTEFAIIRLAQNGSVDTSFGNGGLVRIGSVDDVYATGIELRDDGSGVVFGYASLDSVDFAVLAIDANGVPDPDFGGGDFIFSDIVSRNLVDASVRDLEPLPDGKFLSMGQWYRDEASDIVLIQYLPNGEIDTSYGNEGIVLLDFADDQPEMMKTQADGKAVIVSTGEENGDDVIEVYRVNTDGSLDTSFGIGGMTVLQDTTRLTAQSLVIQADGRIVVGGRSGADLILARLGTDGALDTSFGLNRYTGFSNGRGLTALAMQGDNIIGTGGDYTNGIRTYRFFSDGTRDLTFGLGGVAESNLNWAFTYATDVAVQPDNRIVVTAGQSDSGSPDFAIERYNPDGTLDSTFGNAGTSRVDVGTSEFLYSVELQSDGKITVAGTSRDFDWTYMQFRVVRLNANGSVDPSFGNDGVATTWFHGTNQQIYDHIVTDDGGILASGWVNNGSVAIARFFESTTGVAPVAIDDWVVTDEATVLNGNLFDDNGFGVDFDYDDLAFEVSELNSQPLISGDTITLPSQALVTVNSDGTFSYDPNGQFNHLAEGESATDTFVYRITEGALSSEMATVTVTINGIDGFEVVDDVLQTDANTRFLGDVSLNDSTSADALYSVISAPQNGVVQLQGDGEFSYRPHDGFVGIDSFVYEVNDGMESDSATVELTIGNQGLLDDLVAYWNFDELFGGFEDLSPTDSISDDATPYFDPAFSDHGILNGGITFDGVDDALHIPTSTELNDRLVTKRTISFWFQANELPVDGSKQVLYEEGAQSGFNAYLQDGLLYLGVWRNHGRGSVTFLETNPGEIEVGKWYHVTMVLDAPELGVGTFRGYLNGNEFAQAAAEHVPAHRAGIGIGAMHGGSAYHDTGRINRNGFSFNGTIDEFRIYNRVLSAAEIGELTPANLVEELTVHWKADEGVGTELVDSSPDGSDNLATLVGVTHVQGQQGGGLYFDGTGYVAVENSDDINLSRIDQRTISLNFKAADLSGRQVLYKQGFNSGFNIYLEDGDLVVGGYRNAGRGWLQFFRTSNIESDVWHQVTITLQSTGNRRGTFAAYLDGDEFGRGLAGNISLNSSSISLGKLQGGSHFQNSGAVTNEDYFYAGEMDDIRMYNRALTSNEVAELYRRR